ncbi:hypothetical protein EVAR_83621_1 [Eumeta japonica]|uniref:Uncharacterized protein n=1 Tax=Eumeta variegata TaxID=151549 RepID=A0A4C1UP41_EUMVA|nr:hypothetical protein EVAR_83621_1 [Eumeta japonica]
MFALTIYLLAAAAAAAAAPATHYDQRQDGEMNVRADVQNIILIVAIPQKLNIPGMFKSIKAAAGSAPEMHERTAGVGAVEAFVEPSTPYRVEITAENVTPVPLPVDADGDSREVVIAARRNGPGSRAHAEPAVAWDSLKLIGALEQCGPGRARDNEGICRPHPDESEAPEASASPEPAPSSSPELAPSSSPSSISSSHEDLTTISQPISVVKI